jgi:large subunit ribosomal protein L29
VKAAELREKTVEELNELNAGLRRRLFDLRFKHYTGQLMETHELRNTRREIARVATVIRERELAQQANAAQG